MIRILLIEDNAADARLIREAFAESEEPRFTLTHVDRVDSALALLAGQMFDLILTDLHLPDSTGKNTYNALLARASQIPLVVLTSHDGDSLALQAVQAGAQDYLVKGQMESPLVVRAIRYAIERHRTATTIRELNETLEQQNDYLSALHDISLDLLNRHETDSVLEAVVERAIAFNHADAGEIVLLDRQDEILSVNVIGIAPVTEEGRQRIKRGEGLIGQVLNSGEMLVVEDYQTWAGNIRAHVAGEKFRAAIGVPILIGRKCTGVLGLARLNDNPQPFTPLEIESLRRFTQLIALVLDNTRLYAEAQHERDLLHMLMDNVPDLIYFKDRAARFTRINQAFAQLLNISDPQAVVGKTSLDLQTTDYAKMIFAEEQELMETRQRLVDHVTLNSTIADEPRWFSATKVPIVNRAGEVDGLVGISRDITARRWEERRLRAQYRITRLLSLSSDLLAAAPKILHAIIESLEWDLGELWMVNKVKERLELVDLRYRQNVLASEFESATRQRTFTKGDGFSGRVWEGGKPLWMKDIMNEPGFTPLAVAARIGLHGAIGFPIQFGEEVLGVMTFFSQSIRQPDPDLLNMFASVGSQIGQFIERRRVESALRASEAKLNYLFRRFVPSAVADQLMKTKQHAVKLGGERRWVSVLFADIRGYTALTETLEPPALLDVLNDFFGIVGRVILKYGGTINQYAGDMVMASFNAPDPQPDHAQRAVRAALDAQAEIQRQQPKIGMLDVQFGMGVNTGSVVVGYVGFEDRFDYATLGETTNIAFRLSSTAEGGQVLIAPETYQAVRDSIRAQSLGELKLKGRSDLMEVYWAQEWLEDTRGESA